jgi:hypothetical protein
MVIEKGDKERGDKATVNPSAFQIEESLNVIISKILTQNFVPLNIELRRHLTC